MLAIAALVTFLGLAQATAIDARTAPSEDLPGFLGLESTISPAATYAAATTTAAAEAAPTAATEAGATGTPFVKPAVPPENQYAAVGAGGEAEDPKQTATPNTAELVLDQNQDVPQSGAKASHARNAPFAMTVALLVGGVFAGL